jgi:hypothetical protein
MSPRFSSIPAILFAFLALTLSLPMNLAVADDFPLLRINEFMASNRKTLLDSDGSPSDWIEIHNAGTEVADISGYYLTDDFGILKKWAFPAGTTIGAGGYLTVFASGKTEAADPEELHANFSLQASGEYLGLVEPDGRSVIHAFDPKYEDQREDVSYGIGIGAATTEVTYVAPGADCTWFVPSEDIGSDWRLPGFEDGSFGRAKTGIGYDYDELTGENGNVQVAMQGKNASIFVRVPFQVASPAQVVKMKLRMKYEDGFVAFINGEEIASVNRPGELTWESQATGSHPDDDARVYEEFGLDFAGHLKAGTNILAIQGMNATRGGSDLLVLPELTGEESTSDGAKLGYFVEPFGLPTPGGPNNTNLEGFVGDTRFDTDRGFYEQPFDLKISTQTEKAKIRYTLDGTEPTEEDGTDYAGPLRIDQTSVVRAAAFRSGYVTTNIDTHTYIFVADVPSQRNMRSQITEDDEYGPLMAQSLTAVPTISLATSERRELNGSSSRQLEVPTSAEMLFPDGTEGFHINCGSARFGGFATNFPKKSFRLYFRREYGEPQLNYPVFDGFDYDIPPVEEFDSLSLRSGSHDMNQRGAYMSNRFCDDTMLEMKQIAPHGRFVHVYINGAYWGQYHLRERWHAPMFARYFGGNPEDYEAIDANNRGDQFENGSAYDGSGVLWREARNRVREDNPFTAAGTHIDIANYIDWMIMWGSGNSESEFRAAGGLSLGEPPESALGVPFKFFLKDADGYLRGHSTGRATHNGPLNLFRELRSEKDPEHITLIGDRLHKHFFNDGAMTSERLVARLQRRKDEVQLSFISEAARWNFRTPNSWESTVDGYLNRSLPNVNAGMIRAYVRAGLYPDVVAPVFSQHGGSIPDNGTVQITADNVIYYTTDGSDPRLVGGEINPTASIIDGRGEPRVLITAESEWKYLDDGLDQGTAWRQPGYDDGAWASGLAELGYGDRDEKTVISFGESAAQKHVTYYFRKSFEATDVERAIGLTLGLRRDDGAAVYVNGTEVARSNLPTGVLTFETLAGGGTGDEKASMPFEIDPAVLVNGTNVIAVEVHQERANSSDVSFDATLDATLSQGTPTVNLAGPTTLKARVFDGENWSALDEALFYPASVEPTKANLAISEIMYNPGNPTAAEISAGHDDSDEFEFIELLNIGNETINLGRAAFTDGIAVRIDENEDVFLAPGKTALLVRNQSAFAARYGAGLPVIGSFAGNLRNSGEGLLFESASGTEVQKFAYDDQAPWSTAADGDGHSLELIDPLTGPDHSKGGSWRASAVSGGSPGSVGEVGPVDFATWQSATFTAAEIGSPAISGPDADSDRDLIPVLLEFAFGTNPKETNPALGLRVEVSNGTTILSYPQSRESRGVTSLVEMSDDLTDFVDASDVLVFHGSTDLSDSTRIVTYEYTGAETAKWFRLKVTSP